MRDLKTIAQEVCDQWVRGDVAVPLMQELKRAVLDAPAVPTGYVQLPQNIEQAKAMLLVADAWLQAHEPTYGKLLFPAKTKNQWRHEKSGNTYELLGHGNLQTDKPLSDMAALAIYMGADGQLWAREAREFGERFTKV